MEKLRLPPEYKDFYHLKEEDLEKLNRHIEYFEGQKKRRKIIRRWIFGGVIVILIFMVIFGIVDLSYFIEPFKPKTFLIKEEIEVKEGKITIRVSMPLKEIVNVLFEPTSTLTHATVTVSNKYDVKKILIKGVESVNIKYDKKLFFIFEDKEKSLSIENLKPIE